jgi:virginiamycin A acetyltransferase
MIAKPFTLKIRLFSIEVAEAIAWLLLLPLLISFKTKLFKYHTITTALSIFPGRVGMTFRRAWYKATLLHCGKRLYVDFLGWIRTPKTQVGDNVYIGINSWVGLADIGSNVLISGGVIVLSGRHQHNTDNPEVPISESGGMSELVTIGNDVWIGAGAIVGADVADGCVVGAGTVVVHPTNPYEVVAGVPAKVIKKRMDV